jgi:hypothetical protein
MPRLALLPFLGLLAILVSGWQSTAPGPSPADSASQPCQLDPSVDGPWFDSVVAFEHFDMGRTHLFRCATFSGQFNAGNVVTQAILPQTYVTPYNLVIKNGGLFVYGGAYGDYPGAPGSFVARIDASGNELWRTQLFDAQAHPEVWNYPGVVGVHLNGFLYVVYGTTLAKLDPDTGEVLASLGLPFAGAAEDTAYNGFDGFADGSLVMKTVNRVAGCQEQGFSAFLQCPNPTQVPNSIIAVVNPDTMTLLAQAEAPEPIGGRLTTTRYNGSDLAYLMGSQKMFRYVWNGSTLQLDGNWGPVPYLQAGQTSAPAAAIMGDWVVAQTNGLPSPTPLSLVAARQSDAKLVSMQPFSNLKPGEGTVGAQAFLPSMLSVDIPNNRIFVMDAGEGLAEAVSFDQQTGDMQALWRVAQRTLDFSTLIGPSDQRVFMATDIGGPCPYMSCLQNYTQEQVVFRDAATGQELARSDSLPKMTSGALITPGDEGAINYLSLDGQIYQLTVQPSGQVAK